MAKRDRYADTLALVKKAMDLLDQAAAIAPRAVAGNVNNAAETVYNVWADMAEPRANSGRGRRGKHKRSNTGRISWKKGDARVQDFGGIGERGSIQVGSGRQNTYYVGRGRYDRWSKPHWKLSIKTPGARFAASHGSVFTTRKAAMAAAGKYE